MTMGPDDNDRTVGPGLGMSPLDSAEAGVPTTPTEQELTPAPTELEPGSPETVGPGSDAWPDDVTDLSAEEFSSSGDLTPGRILFGKYVVKERLGQGGMGAVWLVRHRELNIDRALKLIVSEAAFDDSARIWFRREARLMARLTHPNIVTVADARIGNGSAYIEMEYVPGKSLKEILQPGVPVPLDLAVRLVSQLCDALQMAHEVGIVHRDLKPANLMLVADRPAGQEQLKVLDFGIATMLGADRAEHLGESDAGQSSSGVFVGTPAYASPEQILDSEVDARSDLYTVGVILFELLTGYRPFHVRTAMSDHLDKDPPPFQEVNPGLDLPPEVEALVHRCLEKDPSRRPQSADEIARELRIASGFDQPEEALPQLARQHLSRWALLAIAAVPITLAVAVPMALRPSPSFQPRVEIHPVVRAGEELVLPILLERVRFPDPVRLEIAEIPQGLSIIGGNSTRVRSLGGWAVETESAVESVRIETDLNAEPGDRTLSILALAGDTEHLLDVPLTIEPPRLDLPLGFERAEGSRLVPLGPLNCPDAIVRRFDDGTEATFLLIPKGGVNDPDPFYILRDKVSNALYRQFDGAQALEGASLPRGVQVEEHSATESEVKPDWPVMGITAKEAHRFAAWLGGSGPRDFGRLPTTDQWDRASGYSSSDEARGGPFQPEAEAGEFDGIAIGRDDPAPVGQSPRDVSPFGVRDMAGNGFEWTRNATSGRTIPLPEGRNDPIYLRGQGFTMDRPFLFSDIESEDRWRSLGYEESFYEIGFRVVIEMGA